MKKKDLLIAFLLSTILGCLITIPNIIVGKGIFSLIDDFNFQQIPFLMSINQSIKSGEVLWTWGNELGSNFIGSYSFYNLLSPFNIITYLFPSNIIKYLMGPLIILKYGVAGLTSYLFIRRYTKTNKTALIGSLLYAFSGFQLTNILFFHFHDVVALFPLLLYSLDKLVYDNKKGYFALALLICSLTNWFFAIGEIVFIIIYYFVKVICKEYEFSIKKTINVAGEGLLGIGMSLFILYPVFLFTLGNPRISSSWDIKSMLIYPLNTYIEIIRGLISPNEVMSFRAFINLTNYNSIEAYLPAVGIVLVIPYLIKNIRKWDSILFIICLICMFIPILNSMFFIFQTTYYARWFFMPILIMCLISVKTIENNYKIKSGVIVSIFSYLLLIILTIVLKQQVQGDIIFRPKFLIGIILFTLTNLITLIIIYKNKKAKRIKLLLYHIIIFIIIWGNVTIYGQKDNREMYREKYWDYLNSSAILDKYQDSRTNGYTNCFNNFGNVSKVKNIKSWNSNIMATNFEFINSISNIERGVNTIIPVEDKAINNFLGVDYVLSCGKKNLDGYGYDLVEKHKYIKIYRNNEALSIGFKPKKYILDKDYNKLSIENRRKILLESVVLNNEQIEKYKDLFNKSHIESKFKYVKNGLTSTITASDKSFVVYQIPYDEGWNVRINNKKVEIEKVDNGLIGVPIDKGINEITFKYEVPGLKEGLIISVISLIIYIIYILFNSKRGGKYEKS